MALARVKTWSAGEVLTASDLNSEFNNILSNPGTLISGATGDSMLFTTLKQVQENVVTIDNYASLAAAITAIGAAETTLIIHESTTVSTNVTVPSTLTVWFWGQGKLAVATGVTVTINGPLLAPDKQIFSLTGTGVVRFGNSGLTIAKAIWWGLTLDNTGDNSTALQAAINAVTRATSTQFPMKLELPRGRIRYTTTLTIADTGDQAGISVWIAGPGHGNYQASSTVSPIENGSFETILNYTGSSIAIKTQVSRIKMGGFCLTSDTDGSGTTTATGGLQVGNSTVSGEASYNHFYDMAISNFTTVNAWGAASHATVGQYGTYWENVSFNGNYDGYYVSESGGGFNTHTTFMNCAFQTSVRYGFHKPQGGTHHSHYFYSPLFQHNGADAIHVDGGLGLYRFFTPYFEQNNKTTAGYTCEFDGQASIIGTPSSYLRSSSMISPIFINPGASTTGEMFLRQTKDFVLEAIGGSLVESMRIELSGRNPGFTRIPYDQARTDLGLLVGQLGLEFTTTAKGLWGFCAKYGDSVTNAIPDWSGNSNHVSLVDGAAATIDEDFDPNRSNGGGPTSLFFGGSREWEAADNASLSFTSGGLSIVALIKPVTKTSTTIVAKYNDSGGREYRFYFDASGRVNFEVWDESVPAYLGRYYSSTSYITLHKWHVLIATYSGGTAATDIKLYGMKDSEQYPSQLDDTSTSSGVYVAMENLTAKVGNYVTLSAAKAQKSNDEQAFMMIVAEELTLSKVKAITAMLAHYAGMAPPTNVP